MFFVYVSDVFKEFEVRSIFNGQCLKISVKFYIFMILYVRDVFNAFDVRRDVDVKCSQCFAFPVEAQPKRFASGAKHSAYGVNT